ncbi:putative nadh flavin oxidoreductase nadh oxidase [Lyophyllum shimeji]|uniref:Nadh flavin oxidoreductase nadh oxidase n=1 Tax=Lyophyllum shimeji TaxID=47721 RepID=A0A9P3PHR7_LYOSH|nr:putative nadh flavin oxidoreductase nadh oxidase [Lyophyllum shimeji]
MAHASHRLFQPITIGNAHLRHRVILAPLTRFKATKTTHIPIVPLVQEYYSQRSSVPGTLVITEATFIAAKAGGYYNIPGIWSDEQVHAWKQVTDAVHANGSYIFLQLWALGRTAEPDVLIAEDPSFSFVAPSSVPLSERPAPPPRELKLEEIQEYVQLYVQAAKNAVEKAGFDGVEIHGANGYLIDQFLQDVSNQRTDGYGGSIEARSRFGLEVVAAVANAVGEKKTAIRLSPWSPFQSMGMEDPIPQFSHFVSTLKRKHPNLAYLHVVEPRISGNDDRLTDPSRESNEFIRAIWKPLPLIVAGGYIRETALKTADENGELVAFGRLFISNPDLPLRLKADIPLTPYDRKTFYIPGDHERAEVGYIDYPFAKSQGAAKADGHPHF